MRPSKNSLRKKRRAEFHGAVNALAEDSTNAEALLLLQRLKEQYFTNVDGELDRLATKRAENAFVNNIVAEIDHGGWVTLNTPDGAAFQVKVSVWDYIRSRQRSDVHAAMAVEHLVKRAVNWVQPRLVPQRA